MKKRFWLIVLTALFLSPLIFISNHTTPASSGGQPGGGDSWELNRAIKELADPDQYVRRRAARKISRLSKVPGIQRVVFPLIDAIEGQADFFEGNFNRSIFLKTLGAVVRELRPQVHHAQVAVDFMAEVLETNNSDLVRVGAALGLGITLKEWAIEPLELSADYDPSPMVRQASSFSIDRLKRELGIEEELSRSFSTTEFDDPEMKKLQEYIRTHFIIFGNGR